MYVCFCFVFLFSVLCILSFIVLCSVSYFLFLLFFLIYRPLSSGGNSVALSYLPLVTFLATLQVLLIVGPNILSAFKVDVACFIETSMLPLLRGGNTED